MTLFKTSFITKITVFIASVILSVSAMALDFNQTQRLANQGDVIAQFNLGNAYYQGEGVRQDYAQARQWYQKSANQGDVIAQYNLGVMYDKGKGVRQDYAKSFEWYQKSANQGDASAQFNLGNAYYQGEGVRQNEATAKEFFGKSCDNGNQDGCDSYRILNQR